MFIFYKKKRNFDTAVTGGQIEPCLALLVAHIESRKLFRNLGLIQIMDPEDLLKQTCSF